MGLIQGSSTTNPLYANYQPGRPLTASEISARQGIGGIPMSSTTNMNAANFFPTKNTPIIQNQYNQQNPYLNQNPYIDSYMQDRINQAQAGNNNVQQPNYPANDRTPFGVFYEKAFQELAPYYKQKLDEANGDLSIANDNIEQDYVMGKRITTDDFTNNMATLGITLPAEQTQLQGNLNKRGFAVTENPQGQTQYAGSGLAANDVSMLNKDQKLRTEAVKRTQQRGLETGAFKKLYAGEKVQKDYRDETNAQLLAHKNEARTRGQDYQNEDIALKQAGREDAEMKAITGMSGSGSKQTSSNWLDYYKGWNDMTSAQNDFNAVYGGNIKKLQSSKPL